MRFTAIDERPWLWLLAGAMMSAGGHLRWGIDVFALLAPIAWLRFLGLTRDRPLVRSWGPFVGAHALAWVIALAGITTAPLPLILAPAFGLPVAALTVGPYLLWSWQHRRCAERSGWTTTLFPAAVVVFETLAHRLSPFGVWGHGANLALWDLPLMQLAALTGASGISCVLAWVAVAGEARMSEEGGARVHRRQLGLSLTVLAAVHVLGDLRLDLDANRSSEVVKVAAVGTDCDLSGPPLPSVEQRERWDMALFERTQRAAAAGAELVVWTEAASVVAAEAEAKWLERVAELARREGVAVVAAYVVPLGDDEASFRYDNAYALFGPDGSLVHRYLKHHPVPGELATRGTGPIPMWTSEALGEVSGAICYDYDFPASAVARGAADLVALPSSDWRGIDPIHTHMARLRAIEGGHALLRSTRYGLSAGIDALGRVRGQASTFDDDAPPVLIVDLPRHGRRTAYAALGEWFAVLAGLVVVIGLVRRSR